MPAQKYHAYTFTVVGTGRLPLDMMRYDRCVPYQQAGTRVPLSDDTNEHSYEMIGYAPIGNRAEPTVARWKSFGWRVVEGSVKTVQA
jgi:hypothetical protein